MKQDTGIYLEMQIKPHGIQNVMAAVWQDMDRIE